MYKVIGIMSGTSMDGVDFIFLETNGTDYVKQILGKSYEYSRKYKSYLKKFVNNININNNLSYKEINKKVSIHFLKFTKKFINEFNIDISFIDFIGFSGQTVLHKPEKQLTIQLGSGSFLAKKLKIKVVSDFRKNDILKGGQGAPIGAYYNQYLSKKINKKAVFVNLGGVGNICYCNNNNIIAFDTGPANALIDDFIWKKQRKKFDKNGKLSLNGNLNKDILNNILKDKYFKKKYPKSLDRQYFHKYLKSLKNLSTNDALHTLSMLTVCSIKKGLDLIDSKINLIILTGGGRKNLFFLKKLKEIIDLDVVDIDSLGLNGDLIEAEAFAYLAIRSFKKLPISNHGTTGVKKSITGGILYTFNQ